MPVYGFVPTEVEVQRTRQVPVCGAGAGSGLGVRVGLGAGAGLLPDHLRLGVRVGLGAGAGLLPDHLRLGVRVGLGAGAGLLPDHLRLGVRVGLGAGAGLLPDHLRLGVRVGLGAGAGLHARVLGFVVVDIPVSRLRWRAVGGYLASQAAGVGSRRRDRTKLRSQPTTLSRESGSSPGSLGLAQSIGCNRHLTSKGATQMRTLKLIAISACGAVLAILLRFAMPVDGGWFETLWDFVSIGIAVPIAFAVLWRWVAQPAEAKEHRNIERAYRVGRAAASVIVVWAMVMASISVADAHDGTTEAYTYEVQVHWHPTTPRLS